MDEGLKAIAAALSIGLGAIRAGPGNRTARRAGHGTLGRNPEARGPIQQNMILALAFAEAIAI